MESGERERALARRKRRASITRAASLALGLVAFAVIAWSPTALATIEGAGRRPAYAAATAALMAVWWFTEAVPIALTACVPLVLYPLCGVFGAGPVGDVVASAEPYFDAYNFLFLGGMAIGAAMEHFQLHRRVALHIMRAIGTEPKRLLLGMLVATAAVSMWISNTATAVMMLPIALALVAQLERANGGRKLTHFGSALMLAVAYASNVGGIGTKIGTGTNSIFCGFVAEKLHRDVGFLEFVAIGAPFVLLFLPVVWGVLWLRARKEVLDHRDAQEAIAKELATLGPLIGRERRVAMVFAGAALLWMAGDPLRKLLAPELAGAFGGFKLQPKHYEATVALLAVFALGAQRALPWAAVRRIPWSTLVLLGGSFAMAAGIEASGLSKWLAGELGGLTSLPLAAQVALATAATVALTALASNTATINVALNVLPPALPVLAASTLAASCDFALPAGTPPNAIVFGSGYVRLRDMMRTGFLLDLAAMALITGYTLVWVRVILP
ncbi:MAG: DASS family sodium-coupled anion symporter [Polyangiaceae bacterium]|nr:DASS family sodium-coupled anion symporter [Polyangiaceae bacterium]